MTFEHVDILAVMRAPLEGYPPSLNQLRLLSSVGWRILAIDVGPDDDAAFGWWSHPNIRRLRVGRYCEKASLGERLLQHMRFKQAVRRAIRSARPRSLIAYDPDAIFAVGRIWRRLPEIFCVWHFHELFEANVGGIFRRRAVRFAETRAAEVGLVTFPDAGRAEIFQRAVGRPIDSMIVFNCPSRVESLPTDTLRPLLRAQGVDADSAIVLVQGWICPSRCIDQVIRSMAAWPRKSLLVLLGPVEASYKAELILLATNVRMADRVIFLPRVPYAKLFGHTIGADLGLSLVSEGTESLSNWKYSAGAINKRFEYMALGLPQVANIGPGMAEVIDESETGRLVDPEDPSSIGRAVADLLAHPAERRRISANARAAHLVRYCYEVQFAPVLAKFRAVLGPPSSQDGD